MGRSCRLEEDSGGEFGIRSLNQATRVRILLIEDGDRRTKIIPFDVTGFSVPIQEKGSDNALCMPTRNAGAGQDRPGVVKEARNGQPPDTGKRRDVWRDRSASASATAIATGIIQVQPNFRKLTTPVASLFYSIYYRHKQAFIRLTASADPLWPSTTAANAVA
ncbi:hypothetical protein CC78DRAFT_582083 [Lojkania enalia]|uniref:Uncharacterized protein n=1 Tax=Lojkania enalia TaxID=147567 RepID=A0A9P4KBA1_9PLEO|nr:hypothetical protein CC78DRAFT_582083 [Didymosphaeria enalia]